MTTTHKVHFGDARTNVFADHETIDLVVTSPPYPMIEMWDSVFGAMNPATSRSLERLEGLRAFELMHQELDKVWGLCARALKQGGFLCINIGDATRTIGGEFQLYPNHARISSSLLSLGLTQLPDILWRKQTNAPNKFLGSGMLPAGAYVTYEHEYILIFRKGGKRLFKTAKEKAVRKRSAFFWEERNVWFSDLWNDLKGTAQKTNGEAKRERNAAYPFELAYRLICMYSCFGDTVLDPFLGTGTTTQAAIACGRNSVGIDIDDSFASIVDSSVRSSRKVATGRTLQRLSDHRRFIEERLRQGKKHKHENTYYHFPVVTSQETGLELTIPVDINGDVGAWLVEHRTADAPLELDLPVR